MNPIFVIITIVAIGLIRVLWEHSTECNHEALEMWGVAFKLLLIAIAVFIAKEISSVGYVQDFAKRNIGPLLVVLGAAIYFVGSRLHSEK